MGKIRFKLHEKIKAVIFFLLLPMLVYYSCNNSPKESSASQVIEADKTDSNYKPIFWELVCQTGEFPVLFDCNEDSISHQIELQNDPFKDLLILTIKMNSSHIDAIYYSRFIFKSKTPLPKNRRQQYKHFSIGNPMTKDSVYCYFTPIKKIVLNHKEDTLINFLKTTIWNMPTKDESEIELDAETWQIKGRNGKAKILLTRSSFNDSIYYSNIQRIIDICNIKDYEYKKR